MYLFVYGTLKKGHGNHRVLRGAELIGEFTIPGFDMYSMGGFPGIVRGEGTITTELYKITEDHLPWLDSLEGYSEKWNPEDCMYLREKYTLISEVGTWDGWIYIWNSDVSRRTKIESGVWG